MRKMIATACLGAFLTAGGPMIAAERVKTRTHAAHKHARRKTVERVGGGAAGGALIGGLAGGGKGAAVGAAAGAGGGYAYDRHKKHKKVLP